MYTNRDLNSSRNCGKQSEDKNGGRIVKEKFTQAEDDLLKYLVKKYGTNKWNLIGSLMCGRNSRQCRDRWNHYLCDENLNHEEFTQEDDELLLKLYYEIGSRWTIIAKHFERRNSVIVRNRIFKLLRKYNKKTKDKIKPKEKKKKTQTYVYMKPIDNALLNPNDEKKEERKIIFPSCLSLPFVFDDSNFPLFNST